MLESPRNEETRAYVMWLEVAYRIRRELGKLHVCEILGLTYMYMKTPGDEVDQKDAIKVQRTDPTS
jgi:hypothetical protein